MSLEIRVVAILEAQGATPTTAVLRYDRKDFVMLEGDILRLVTEEDWHAEKVNGGAGA